MFVCLSEQPTHGLPAIGFCTRASLANKWIVRRTRISAHFIDKHSEDLRARPVRTHPSGIASIGFCTGATLADKWIAPAPRFSAHSDGWGVLGGGPLPPRHHSPRYNHLSSEQRIQCFLFRAVADFDRLDAPFLALRRSVSPERLPYGRI